MLGVEEVAEFKNYGELIFSGPALLNFEVKSAGGFRLRPRAVRHPVTLSAGLASGAGVSPAPGHTGNLPSEGSGLWQQLED